MGSSGSGPGLRYTVGLFLQGSDVCSGSSGRQKGLSDSSLPLRKAGCHTFQGEIPVIIKSFFQIPLWALVHTWFLLLVDKQRVLKKQT